jgi:signal transduction histidine kinase
VIAVSDTGIGIAAEDLERVLQPFAQADTGLARRYEGTGLGLPICKALAELHGATLTITSTVGRGTTVTVRFDAARVYREVA